MIRPLPTPAKPIKLDVSLAIVNIVLLLILFFLATGQLLNPRTGNVDLSETSELPLDALPSPILVVSDNGDWALDGAPVAPALVGTALAALPDDSTLHVLISRNAPASALVNVMTAPALENTTLRLVTIRTGQAAP